MRAALTKSRFQQNLLPPTAGSWVVEDNVRAKGPVIVRFYDNMLHELHADTLACRRLNPKSRPAVLRLNEQLRDWLAPPSVAVSAGHDQTP